MLIIIYVIREHDSPHKSGLLGINNCTSPQLHVIVLTVGQSKGCRTRLYHHCTRIHALY